MIAAVVILSSELTEEVAVCPVVAICPVVPVLNTADVAEGEEVVEEVVLTGGRPVHPEPLKEGNNMFTYTSCSAGKLQLQLG